MIRSLAALLIAVAAVPAAAAPGVDSVAPAAGPTFVSRGGGVFGGSAIAYVATAGFTPVKLEDGLSARMFSVAYVRSATGDEASRPVTFIFNGGPGSSAIWLHLGAFGPRRIAIPDGGASAGLPPYRMEANPDSLLDVSDLVFVDPVGAGFSHAEAGSSDGQFANLIDDGASFSEFVRNWLVKNGRENSPKYILGESYGSVRAGMMVRDLRRGGAGKIIPNGVILLGQDMDTTITQQTPANDMPFVLYFPGFAVTAWYHNKVPHDGRTVEQVYAEARDFARTDLQTALFQGSALPVAERDRIAARMAQLIGLPQSLIARENLRIGTALFMRELLQDQRRLLLRSDARFTTAAPILYEDKDIVSDAPGIYEAFNAAGNEYLRGTLGIRMGEPYQLISSGKWDYTLPDNLNPQQTYHDVTPYVAAAMRDNPSMRLFFGSGYYDLMATPLSVERNYTHAGLPLDRITARIYPVGHMIFLDKKSLGTLAADLRAFIRQGAAK